MLDFLKAWFLELSWLIPSQIHFVWCEVEIKIHSSGFSKATDWYCLPPNSLNCDGHLNCMAAYMLSTFDFCLPLQYWMRRDWVHCLSHYHWAVSLVPFFQMRQGVVTKFPRLTLNLWSSRLIYFGSRIIVPLGSAYFSQLFHFPDLHLSANARMGILKIIFLFHMFISLFLKLSYYCDYVYDVCMIGWGGHRRQLYWVCPHLPPLPGL